MSRSTKKRIDVCFLNTRFFPVGGTAIRTLNFAKAIKDRADKVRIITWQPANESVGLGNASNIATEGVAIDIIQIKHHFLKKHLRFLYLFALGLEYFFFVRKNIKVRNPDIIHCGNETFWMSILLKRFVKRPIIADIHDLHTISIVNVLDVLPHKAAGLSGFLSRTALRMANNSVDMFLCPTEELRSFLISSGISSEKVKAIANAMSTPQIDIVKSRARVRTALGLPDETTVVAFHGVLNTSYNLDAITCLGKISKIVNNRLKDRVKFIVIGYFDSLPVHDESFIYTGYVENLYEYLSAADFAVIPIFENSLGIRSRLLDYFLLSIPVITTPVGVTGMKFAQESGAVIVRNNTEELAESTIRLASSKRDLKAMAQRSADLIKWFSPDKIANDLMSIYLQVTA